MVYSFRQQQLILCDDILGTEQYWKSSIPRPDDFSKAIYTFDIGQNDLAHGLQNTSEEQVQASLPNILRNFSQAVKVD
jgi:hypothetical protein